MSKKVKDVATQEILDLVQKRGTATIDEISKSVFISKSSVRRKLNDLQEQGLIVRSHGGARISESGNLFPSFSFRSRQNSFEKKKIAISAVGYVADGDFIFLDGSTSAFFFADALKDMSVSVMTNGIDTVSELSKHNVEAYSTGGKVSATNRSVLVGQNAINTIEHYHADLFIFSAQSVDRDGNIYDCFEEENFVRIAMMKNAVKKIFLCDGSKLGKASKFKLCRIEDVDRVVSDADLRSYFVKDYGDKIASVNKL